MLLGAFAVVVVVIAVLLWAPIDLALVAERERKLRVRVRVSWLGGLVTKEFDEREPPSAPEKARREPRERRTGRRGSFSRISRMASSKGFVRSVVRLARRIVTGIEVRRAELWARAGLDDPADTGVLYAYSFPFTRMIQSSLPVRIELEPDFSGEGLAFRGHGDFRVVPARVVGPALAFALSRPTLRAMWAARS